MLISVLGVNKYQSINNFFVSVEEVFDSDNFRFGVGAKEVEEEKETEKEKCCFRFQF